MFDTAIIGTGPAGISAALTLRALKKNIILFGTPKLSQKIRAAELIRNYPGLPGVTGGEMRDAFARQLEEMEIPVTGKTVTGIYHMGSHYSILCDQEQFEAKTVILATGVTLILGNVAVEGKVDVQALILTVLLAILNFGSRIVRKKKIAPIPLIGISALLGILVCGIL